MKTVKVLIFVGTLAICAVAWGQNLRGALDAATRAVGQANARSGGEGEETTPPPKPAASRPVATRPASRPTSHLSATRPGLPVYRAQPVR